MRNGNNLSYLIKFQRGIVILKIQFKQYIQVVENENKKSLKLQSV